MTADLTPAQAARLDEVERVARAMHVAHLEARQVGDPPTPTIGTYRRLAVAAIDVMRGATDDGAIGRCGDAEPSIVGEQTGRCALPAGHAGWHRSDAGSEWTYGTPATAEGDDRG